MTVVVITVTLDDELVQREIDRVYDDGETPPRVEQLVTDLVREGSACDLWSYPEQFHPRLSFTVNGKVVELA